MMVSIVNSLPIRFEVENGGETLRLYRAKLPTPKHYPGYGFLREYILVGNGTHFRLFPDPRHTPGINPGKVLEIAKNVIKQYEYVSISNMLEYVESLDTHHERWRRYFAIPFPDMWKYGDENSWDRDWSILHSEGQLVNDVGNKWYHRGKQLYIGWDRDEGKFPLYPWSISDFLGDPLEMKDFTAYDFWEVFFEKVREIRNLDKQEYIDSIRHLYTDDTEEWELDEDWKEHLDFYYEQAEIWLEDVRNTVEDVYFILKRASEHAERMKSVIMNMGEYDELD